MDADTTAPLARRLQELVDKPQRICMDHTGIRKYVDIDRVLSEVARTSAPDESGLKSLVLARVERPQRIVSTATDLRRYVLVERIQAVLPDDFE